MASATSRWSLRNIYLYLVCLITLIMVIVGVINLVRSSVEIFYPDPYAGPIYSEPAKMGDLNAKQMAEEQRRAREAGRRQAVLSIVGSLATVLVAGPVYVYHWRKIEGELPGQDGGETVAA